MAVWFPKPSYFNSIKNSKSKFNLSSIFYATIRMEVSI